MGYSVGLRGGVGSSSIRPMLLTTSERLLYMNRAWKACAVLIRFSPVGCTSI
jgi:hypothetical protein